MDEALYVVEFGDAAGGTFRNGGVVVLETNRVYGGDSYYYYLGSYTIENGVITATVRIVKHRSGGYSAFGDDQDDFTVTIIGRQTPQGILGRMERVGTPEPKLPLRLLLQAKLP